MKVIMFFPQSRNLYLFFLRIFPFLLKYCILSILKVFYSLFPIPLIAVSANITLSFSFTLMLDTEDVCEIDIWRDCEMGNIGNFRFH